MKRVLTILAILLLPLSVWAMTPVNDSDLSNVTGQAGVNINADLTMNITIGTMAWGDSDGIQGTYDCWATNTSGGYIGIKGFDISNLKIRARAESTDAYNSYTTFLLKPITIDVATAFGADYSTVNYDGTIHTIANGTTFVRFGLGALHISMDSLSFDIALGSHAASYIGVDPTLNQTLGTVTIGGLDVYINPFSYVDIYNSALSTNGNKGTGVTFAFNIILDAIKIPYMSWGDGDGLQSSSTTATGAIAGFKWISTNNTAGYIGLNNFQMGNATEAAVTVTGAVAIDVLTDKGTGVYSGLSALMAALKPVMRTEGYNPTSYADTCKFINVLKAEGLWATGDSIGLILAKATASGLAGTVVPSQYSMVHITFPEDMNVVMQSMWADVQIADTANFASGTGHAVGELGDIYIQGMHLNIVKGSWVDIWAH